MEFGQTRAGKVEPVALPTERANKSLLAACRYFATERWDFLATVQSHSVPSRFELFVILSGTGCIHSQGPIVSYRPGECWFLPATLGEFSLQPEQTSAVIRTFIPDLMDLRAELQQMGLNQRQLERVIFPD
jgi:mannose-6-phosphate isomerase class I